MDRTSGASASLQPLELPGRGTPPGPPRHSWITRSVRRSAPARRFHRLRRPEQTAVEVALTFIAPPLVGLAVYLPMARYAPGLLAGWFWLLFAAMVVTTMMILLEVARAHRFPEPPVGRIEADADLPRVASVVAAYLPNEEATLEEALRAHLAMDYPVGKHVVVLAYNTPEPMSIESRLADYVDPTSHVYGTVLKAFMPNIVMIDFADPKKCKTIYELNQAASTSLTNAAKTVADIHKKYAELQKNMGRRGV